jgi:MFS transporter, OPA family, glycerol-3-phosphate transporter
MTIDKTAIQNRFRFTQWRILLATMFCYLFYYTGRQTFGFAIPGIEAEFGLSKTALGYFGTGLLWAYAIGQAVNGNLGDKYGGRKIVSVGAILSCLLNWIVSFGVNFWSLFIPWTANGYVQSMGWAPGSRVLSNWFGQHERGRVFGLFMFAAGLSSILAFVTSLVILKTFNLDWRWIFRLPVLLLLLGGVAYYLLVRDHPGELGFSSPGDKQNDTLGLTKTKDGAETSGENETSLQRYLTVLKNWRFMVACIGIGFQSSARYGLLIWVPVHFLGQDWKNSDAAWISIALPVGMALGAITGGWMSDKVFHSIRWKLISSFMTLASVMSMIMYFLPKEHGLGIVVLFLCGFFAYGSQSAFWALCPDLLGTKRSGTGVGIMDFFAYLFAGIVSPLIGKATETYAIVDQISQTVIDNTALVFPIVAFSCFICAIIGLIIKR